MCRREKFVPKLSVMLNQFELAYFNKIQKACKHQQDINLLQPIYGAVLFIITFSGSLLARIVCLKKTVAAEQLSD